MRTERTLGGVESRLSPKCDCAGARVTGRGELIVRLRRGTIMLRRLMFCGIGVVVWGLVVWVIKAGWYAALPWLVLALLVLVPATISMAASRFLKGWMRVAAVPVLLIGLPAIPYLVMAPGVARLFRTDPNVCGLPMLSMLFFMLIVVFSVLVGFSVGVSQWERDRQA